MARGCVLTRAMPVFNSFKLCGLTMFVFCTISFLVNMLFITRRLLLVDCTLMRLICIYTEYFSVRIVDMNTRQQRADFIKNSVGLTNNQRAKIMTTNMNINTIRKLLNKVKGKQSRTVLLNGLIKMYNSNKNEFYKFVNTPQQVTTSQRVTPQQVTTSQSDHTLRSHELSYVQLVDQECLLHRVESCSVHI
ncbi:hypothetical protein AP053_gp013 [Ostreococcus mediterraneus virus 1]|uniref:hypothetical protein n=1 Tax=Ostreococcus mediterraneus virus 1 TaxID=1663210 RepID=UPI0006D1D31B|nr:hypothetical protein AP053_gp013 [Ostreococcus mediterraneus virus 1]ALI95124.1 hypothetical protein OmV1_013c [Ostreococcus mediterraneus virus 1]